MRLHDLVGILEEIAPPALAEDFDAGRIGLAVEGSAEVTRVATALDPTPYAIRRAIDAGAQALVTHHALIWDPVNAIDAGLAVRLKLLLDAGLSLYTMHTNYDNAPGGVNDVLAGLVGLSSPEPFRGGRIGDIPETALRPFAAGVARKLGCGVEYAGDGDRRVRRVAVAAGSGFRQGLGEAMRAGADALLSSELKHDVILGCGGVALVSAPHYFTEAPAMRALADRLSPIVPAAFIDDPPRIEAIGRDGEGS